MSNGNGLQGLIGSKSMFTIWTKLAWLACTEYRLVPSSPCMLFKNNRHKVHYTQYLSRALIFSATGI